MQACLSSHYTAELPWWLSDLLPVLMGSFKFPGDGRYSLCFFQALAELAVEAEKWEEARQLADDHPDLCETVFSPWAEWLVSRGSFQEARLAYRYCSCTSKCQCCIR